MASHKYIMTAGYKPTPDEIEVGELVINMADATLWSKNESNGVFNVTIKDVPGGIPTPPPAPGMWFDFFSAEDQYMSISWNNRFTGDGVNRVIVRMLVRFRPNAFKQPIIAASGPYVTVEKLEDNTIEHTGDVQSITWNGEEVIEYSTVIPDNEWGVLEMILDDDALVYSLFSFTSVDCAWWEIFDENFARSRGQDFRYRPASTANHGNDGEPTIIERYDSVGYAGGGVPNEHPKSFSYL